MKREPSNQVGHTDSTLLHTQIEVGESVQLVDVREPWEHADGVIAGAILMPLGQVQSRWQELDQDRPITLICHLGSRSARAAQFLARQGLTAINVDDGMDGWMARGFPITRPT
jgi:rhodanese-related sulfurtransferase